eukprot:TRINITY_DN16961_c0_g1_i1.p1 TRINITY_DN16961_c0_g1~~TRINITY_DN16961_c0_g1_i1.p1  ORF type:complete len:341 (-),score=78.04 TRINITY_DN16961_c0_g1_i1:142-1164(-)
MTEQVVAIARPKPRPLPALPNKPLPITPVTPRANPAISSPAKEEAAISLPTSNPTSDQQPDTKQISAVIEEDDVISVPVITPREANVKSTEEAPVVAIEPPPEAIPVFIRADRSSRYPISMQSEELTTEITKELKKAVNEEIKQMGTETNPSRENKPTRPPLPPPRKKPAETNITHISLPTFAQVPKVPDNQKKNWHSISFDSSEIDKSALFPHLSNLPKNPSHASLKQPIKFLRHTPPNKDLPPVANKISNDKQIPPPIDEKLLSIPSPLPLSSEKLTPRESDVSPSAVSNHQETATETDKNTNTNNEEDATSLPPPPPPFPPHSLPYTPVQSPPSSVS